MTNTNGLQIIIAIVLIGIFVLLVMQYQRKPAGERIADSIGEVTEEIRDEIDDHTTN